MAPGASDYGKRFMDWIWGVIATVYWVISGEHWPVGSDVRSVEPFSMLEHPGAETFHLLVDVFIP